MKSEFPTMKLSALAEIQTGPFGSQLHKEDYVKKGTPIVTVEHLGNKNFTKQNLPCVSDKDKIRLNKYILKTGDIVFSRVGSVDRCSYVSKSYDGWMFSGRCLRVRPGKMLNAEYLYYFFLLDSTKQFVRNIATGATMPSINTKFMGEVPVVVPPLTVQEKIVDVLRNLDDKIQLNTEINKNLEQQAQAIYKAWFVDFSAFGGTVPNDWQTYHLVDFLPVITGKKNANVSSNQGKYPFFSCSQDYAWTDDYSFDGSAILVAGNGDFNVKFYSGKFEAYQRTYVLIPYEPKYTAWLFYAVQYHLSSITSAARGSVIKFITKGNLEDFEFVAPKIPLSLPVIYNLDTINRKIATNREENLRLGTLRDTLLPKLMSGELDVSNVEI